MIGSLISMVGYWAVVFILVIWMAIRIARSSPLMAVLTFLFWPVAVLALIQNWGDEESDIRVPFFLALLAAGLSVFMAMRAVDKAVVEGAAYFSDAEIEMIRAEDPEMARRIEEARAEAWAADAAGYDGYDDGYREPAGAAPAAGGGPRAAATRRTASTAAAAPAQPRDPADIEAERRSQLHMAASAVGLRFGAVELGHGLSLSLPGHFRFAPRQGLPWLASLHGAELDEGVLGWVVHDRVDLGEADAWFVEVRRLGVAPRLEGREAPELILQRLGAAMGGDAATPGPFSAEWQAGPGVATWSQGMPDAPQQGPADLFAARVLDGHVVAFVMRGADPSRHELGLRATRLMASRVARQ